MIENHKSIEALCGREQTAWFCNQLRFRVELLQEFLGAQPGCKHLQVALVDATALLREEVGTEGMQWTDQQVVALRALADAHIEQTSLDAQRNSAMQAALAALESVTYRGGINNANFIWLFGREFFDETARLGVCRSPAENFYGHRVEAPLFADTHRAQLVDITTGDIYKRSFMVLAELELVRGYVKLVWTKYPLIERK